MGGTLILHYSDFMGTLINQIGLLTETVWGGTLINQIGLLTETVWGGTLTIK